MGGLRSYVLTEAGRQEAEGAARPEPLAVLRDQLAQAIKDTIGTMLQLDFRTPFMGADPNALLRLHEGDLRFKDTSDFPVRSRERRLPVAADAAHIQALGSLGDFAE